MCSSDLAAAKTGIDPAEIRRRNLIKPSQIPYQSATGPLYDSGDFPAVFEKALAAADYSGFPARRAEARNRGKLRGIVNTGERRSALLPDVPTATEQGMPTLQAVNWYAIVVPAKTPRAIIDKLHGAVTGALQAPDLKARLSNEGFEPMISASPEAYTRFHKQEFARWGKVAKGAGVKAE